MLDDYFSKRFRQVIKKVGSQRKLGELLGLHRNTIWKWANDKSIPTRADIHFIAQKTGTSVNYLLGGGRDEIQVIDDEMAQVPIFDAGAGEPSNFTDGDHPVGFADDYIQLPRKDLDENSFCVQIHGDSMFPTLKEGDKVLVVPSKPLENSKLCFVAFPGEMGRKLVKRYRRAEDTIILESDNKDYDPIVLTEKTGEGIRIFRVTLSIRDE